MNFAKGSTSRGRGTSFKGVMAYLTHDKDRARTADRVGEIELVNLFETDPGRIWQEMKATFNAADYLKQKAGIKATGRKLEKPVYAYSLNWHPQDKPTASHMIETAKETLRLLGLQDHQAAIVQHTDTDHAHVHVVVNLVHPATGKAASLSNDDYKLTEWAYRYEQRQGAIRSFGRAAKMEGRRDLAKQPRTRRDEAKARKNTANDNAAAQSAAEIRATFGSRGAAMQDRNRIAQARRKAEIAAVYDARRNATKAIAFAHRSYKRTDSERLQVEQLRHDRTRERDELKAEYRAAVQEIWNERAPAAPTRGFQTNRYSVAHSNALAQIAARRATFEQRETRFVGRLVNTVTVAKSGSTVADLLALAVNAKARRALFEAEQKAETAAAEKLRPAEYKAPRIASKKMRADRLREMQAEGMRGFDLETRTQIEQLKQQQQERRDDNRTSSATEVDQQFRRTLAETKARHADEIARQAEAWRVLKQQRAEAWQAFKEKHRKPADRREQIEGGPAAETTPATPTAAEFQRTATGQTAAPNDGTADPAITPAAEPAAAIEGRSSEAVAERNPWAARRSKAERIADGDYTPRRRGPRMG